ncbi:Hypothetical predicted protein [Marmota monax]|uniref:Uncharacterized protein n=1 Tax=Marmota monax TaxID=9995 RepID=A0A5E4A3P8_MARMO|nr:hypothetical protein GHT09_007578 [Marmota monax]VTJ51342.1 Hypothetical predicted protein [Marmota monax]
MADPSLSLLPGSAVGHGWSPGSCLAHGSSSGPQAPAEQSSQTFGKIRPWWPLAPGHRDKAWTQSSVDGRRPGAWPKPQDQLHVPTGSPPGKAFLPPGEESGVWDDPEDRSDALRC